MQLVEGRTVVRRLRGGSWEESGVREGVGVRKVTMATTRKSGRIQRVMFFILGTRSKQELNLAEIMAG